jgi:4-amino-4-deoxy-L-arabinose transferase-like glycosyltransferase
LTPEPLETPAARSWRCAVSLRAALIPLLLLAAAVACLSFRLGGYPLIDPDEGRNAEVAREMAATRDWVVPRLDGLPYMDKPVLFFAAAGASIGLFGANETAARLPALLMTLATVALTAWFAARLFGSGAAWIAAVATASAPLTIAFARAVIFDSMLTFFMVTALVAFYFAVEGRVAAAPRGRVRAWSVLAWVAMALGVLTKGPVALAVPLLVAAPYAAWRRASRAVWSLSGAAALAALVAPWVWAVSQQVPDFLVYALKVETWGRLTSNELRRNAPAWYFLPVLLAGGLPWSLAAIGALTRSWRRLARPDTWDPRTVYLLLWVVLPFVFFSLSHSKRPHYILPVLPALALIVAQRWCDRARRRLDGLLPASLGVLCASGVLAVAGLYLRSHSVPGVPPQASGVGFALAAVLLLGGAGALAARRRREVAILALALPVLAMLPIGFPLLSQVAASRSTRSLAREIRAATPGERVVAVHTFPPSLAFYLRHPILVSSRDGHELRSNYVLHGSTNLASVPSSPLRPADWWRTLLEGSNGGAVLVVRRDDAGTVNAIRLAGLGRIAEDDDYLAFAVPHTSNGAAAVPHGGGRS